MRHWTAAPIAGLALLAGCAHQPWDRYQDTAQKNGIIVFQVAVKLEDRAEALAGTLIKELSLTFKSDEAGAKEIVVKPAAALDPDTAQPMPAYAFFMPEGPWRLAGWKLHLAGKDESELGFRKLARLEPQVSRFPEDGFTVKAGKPKCLGKFTIQLEKKPGSLPATSELHASLAFSGERPDKLGAFRQYFDWALRHDAPTKNREWPLPFIAIMNELAKRINAEVPPLEQWTDGLRSPNLAVRLTAARALGTLGPLAKGALPALKEALRDPEKSVRRRAERAIERINSASETE